MDLNPVWFIITAGLHLFTMLLGLALTAFYVINVFINVHVPQEKKALWAVIIFLGGPIAWPVYWYLYIWRQPANPAL